MSKIRNRLILLFSAFSLVIILSISVVSHFLIRDNLNGYVEQKINIQKENIVKDINTAYVDGGWNKALIEEVGLKAINDGLILKVTDIQGKIIWDANKDYSTQCEDKLHEFKNNSLKINSSNVIEYVEDSYEIIVDNSKVGIVFIGYSGPIFYNSSEIMLFKALDTTLLIAAIIAIVLSVIIGISVSLTISKPILKMVESTKEIANGNYKIKLRANNNTKEIKEMMNSINELSDSLQKDEELRRMLTRDISHELRTPLTTIGLQIEALVDKVWEPTDERLIGIQNEISRLTRLVKSLEELSEYDSDTLELNKNYTDIPRMIKGLIINFEKQCLDNNVRVKLELKDLILNIDRDKLSQCIINLLSNAIKYTADGGVIEVQCYESSKSGYIIIKDSGIGMKQEHLKNIFKRFYRVDSSRARKTGGVGVGLTISKAIVEAHNGTIRVLSNVGEGSKFTIIIPK